MSDERPDTADAAPETPETAASDGEVTRVVEKRPVWQTVAKWAGIALGVVVLLIAALLIGINTGPGRAYIAKTISNTTLASGLNLKVGEIDGSIYGGMVLRDVTVSDTKGVFAAADQLTVDWRPFNYLSGRIDVRELSSPAISLIRLPELKPNTNADPNAPLLPDLNIDIAKLEIGRLDIGPAVTGNRHIARISGRVQLTNGRAQLRTDVATVRAPGVAGGDRIALKLDAVPEDDLLDIDMRVDAPTGGLIAGLAKLEAPLALRVEGDGSWSSWQGRAVSTLGGEPFANLNLAAKSGNFTVRGMTHPGLYLEGPVERLTSPGLQVAIDAAWADRKADTRIQLRSDAFAFSANGLINLADNRFRNFRAEALLLQPGSIAPNLVGDSVRVQVMLDGPFATPVVDYKLRAAALGFGDTVVRQLYAEGKARVNSDRILIPVRARAGRISGLNQAVGGLVTNLSIDGDFAITGDQILSDNLKLRSDRIAATAIIAADMGDGRYTGALKGRVNDYQIDGVGIVNVNTDAELYAAPGGGWGIRGMVAGQTVRIDNQAAKNFLGGNAVASMRLGYDPRGIITFEQVKLNAPDFRIVNGSGRYDPAGPILINADAVSDQYGPITARVTGTLTSPEVLVNASRPGVGIGLADLRARIRGQNGAYAVTASGGTNYGPFKADVLVRTGGALTVDIRSARFAGMDIDGRIRQTPAGPFAGRVNFDGSGVNGSADLRAAGSNQQAVITARANNAQIPGSADLRIGRAIVDATVTLADTPQVVADVQIANLRSGDAVLTKARAKIDYRGGRGTAQLLAEGTTGVPFRIAANARLAPDQWLVALQGRGSSIDFRTASPARIDVRGGGYRLLPTRIDFDKGSVRLAGEYGDGLTVRARLDKLDLSVVNGFVPGLGIGGSASGALDFTQASSSAFPRADARLQIEDFTRSTLAAVSTPVDVVFVGKLLADGGDARAIIKRGTTTIGRVIATLRPLGPGAGSWNERLMAAPLSGGVRYNGPAAVLFSLAGMTGQTLTGPIGLAADFSGRVRTPQLTGVVRASNLTYENETYGTRLTNMAIEGRFSNDQLRIERMTAKAGDGTVTATGQVGLAADSGFPVKVRVEMKDAQLARSDALAAAANGWVEFTNNRDYAQLRGRLTIPEARYKIIRQGSADVADLKGVRRKGAPGTDRQSAGREPQPAHEIRLDLQIVADNRLFVSGMGLESEWAADLRVGGTASNPQVSGELNVVNGTYSFASRRFELSRQSTVSFQGSAISNPSLNIAATTTAEGVTAIINIGGRAQQPRISFTSTPALPQDEVLARLLFGSSVTNLSATEAIQLAAALNSLRGSGGGGLNPLGTLRSAAGIDRLRILGADDTTGRGTALAAGQYLTDDIYVEIITDARGFTATQLEVALTRALSLLSQTGSFGGSSVSLRYSKDY